MASFICGADRIENQELLILRPGESSKSKILQQTEGISPEDVSLEVMVVNSWELLKKLVVGKCPLACADHKTKGAFFVKHPFLSFSHHLYLTHFKERKGENELVT